MCQSAVTDDKSDVSYLETLDKMLNVDITDDYRSEKAAYRAKTNEKLSFGDYICKLMVGPTDAAFDKFDDQSAEKAAINRVNCCFSSSAA
jgi:hypothetical protein